MEEHHLTGCISTLQVSRASYTGSQRIHFLLLQVRCYGPRLSTAPHLHSLWPPLQSSPLCLGCGVKTSTALQGLAADIVQSGSSGVTAEDQQGSRSDMPAAADGSSPTDTEPAVSGSAKAEGIHEATPVHVSAEAKQPSSSATSGSKSAWFGRAGGLLNRWAVPVKVKKEPKSSHKHGIADVIDLT